MTPPELMLASLGACAGYYAAEYLKKHKLAAEGTIVRVSAGKAKNLPASTIFKLRRKFLSNSATNLVKGWKTLFATA